MTAETDIVAETIRVGPSQRVLLGSGSIDISVPTAFRHLGLGESGNALLEVDFIDSETD